MTRGARATDPSTSHDAAERQTKAAKHELQRRILVALDLKPKTDEELLIFLGGMGHTVTPSGVRSRRAELRDEGMVTELRTADGLPVKRKLLSGSPGQVWRVVQEGEELPDTKRTPTHKGTLAAQRAAAWDLGLDAEQVYRLLLDYLNPDLANTRLDEEQGK